MSLSDSNEMLKSGTGQIDPRAAIRMIDQALSDMGDDDSGKATNSFQFPLSEALKLLPKHYVEQYDPDLVRGLSIGITLEDLYDQLGKGVVQMAVADLAYFVPANFVYEAVISDKGRITLPLKQIVRAVGVEELQKRMPAEFRHYDLDQLDDPFRRGTRSPGTPEPAPAEAPARKPLPVQPAAASGSVRPVPTKAVPPQGDVPATATKAESPAFVPLPAMPPATAAAVPGTASFKYPLAAIIPLLPEGILKDGSSPDEDMMMSLSIPAVFDQLARGKVELELSSVLRALPSELVSGKTPEDPEAMVTLDLSLVVGSVGTDALKRLLPVGCREYGIDRMADPFQTPDELPKKIERRPRKVRSPEPADQEPPQTGAGYGVGKLGAVTVHILHRGSEEAEAELSYREMPGNVNINAATVPELMLLDGVTGWIAQEIVKYRQEHGSFKSVYDLLNIVCVDETLFARMTGMTAGERKYHRRKRLSGLLRIPADQVTDLGTVAQKVAAKPGFSGCLICDRDGFILAQSGAGESAEALGAVAPRLLRRIVSDMLLLEVGSVTTVSIAVENSMYTMAAGDNVIIVAIHDERRVSESELAFVRKVASELSWLLGLRAYVGPRQ